MGQRICIVMMSAIGDAVHVLPVVTALKRHDPIVAHHVDSAAGPGVARAWPSRLSMRFCSSKRRAGGAECSTRAVSSRSATFDLVIDLQVYIKAGLVTAFTRAPVKLGFDKARARDMNWLFTNRRIPPHAPQHVQDQYLEFLAALDVPAEPIEWKLGPWPRGSSARERAYAALPRPYATLVIGATHPEKEWLRERWAELANALRSDFGLEPVLAGGRSARELETAQRHRSRGRAARTARSAFRFASSSRFSMAPSW